MDRDPMSASVGDKTKDCGPDRQLSSLVRSPTFTPSPNNCIPIPRQTTHFPACHLDYSKTEFLMTTYKGEISKMNGPWLPTKAFAKEGESLYKEHLEGEGEEEGEETNKSRETR